MSAPMATALCLLSKFCFESCAVMRLLATSCCSLIRFSSSATRSRTTPSTSCGRGAFPLLETGLDRYLVIQNRTKERKVNRDQLSVFSWCHGIVPLREIPVNRLNFAKTTSGAMGLAVEIFSIERISKFTIATDKAALNYLQWNVFIVENNTLGSGLLGTHVVYVESKQASIRHTIQNSA